MVRLHHGRGPEIARTSKSFLSVYVRNSEADITTSKSIGSIMRGVCFQGVGQVEWQELPDPEMESANEAIVRVDLAGLCGSDLHPFFGRELGLDRGTVMGHEFVGSIVAIGDEVQSLKVGDRVYSPFTTSCGRCYYCVHKLPCRCRMGQAIGWRSQGVGLHGGQAELVRVPLAEGTLKRIPDGMSCESALLLGDNLSTGYFCAEMAQIQPEGITAIIGCGTVGLLSIISARELGANQIVAIEPTETRRRTAAQLGATIFADGLEAKAWIDERTDGRGADSVMELVGMPDAQRLAYDLLRPGGTMSVIGCHSSPTFAFTPTEAYNKNLSYRTGRCPARYYMDVLTPKIVDRDWGIDQLITHRFDPIDCKRAYEIFATQKDGCIKAVFQFSL
jgi:alcohol dehydrogenase